MPAAPPDPAPVGVVVPLRSFAHGKARLGDRLAPGDRARLARTMADRVLEAAFPRPVLVVTSDRAVSEWASTVGAETLPDPGSLDEAADLGRARWRDAGLDRVIVAHADLPLVTTFDPVDDARDRRAAVAVLVPCHRGDGTPVLSIPADAPFPFSYGPGSFARHRRAARVAGLAVRIVRDPRLRFDVDLPDDLDHLDTLGASGWAEPV